MIINQIKIYIYGDIFNIDKYADGSYGWASCVFADTLGNLKDRLKSLIEGGVL